MLAALATLLVCQLAGEVIVRALSLPLPGPVVGMALLFFAMLTRAPAGSKAASAMTITKRCWPRPQKVCR